MKDLSMTSRLLFVCQNYSKSAVLMLTEVLLTPI